MQQVFTLLSSFYLNTVNLAPIEVIGLEITHYLLAGYYRRNRDVTVMEGFGHYRFTFNVAKIPLPRPFLCDPGWNCVYMDPTKTGFFKNEECPSSSELLDYQIGDIAKNRAGEIRRHLLVCEFCEAETEFYFTYPQAPEDSSPETTVAEIPAPLFELAEALFRNRHGDGHSLNSLLKERGTPLPSKI